MNSVKLPQTAILELTYACNHKCKFCSCPWENKETPRLFFEKREELSIDDWKRALRVLEDGGVERVGISGGEPILKEGLGVLLRHIRENTRLNVGAKITLISNGAVMSEQLLSLFKEMDVQLSLSLPGLSTFKYHTDAERNTAENVLYWLNRAREEGVQTTAGITVTKRNINELYETIANALIAGADTILLNRFLVGGRGVTYKDELSLSNDELFKMLNIAETVLETAARKGAVGTEIPYCLAQKANREFKWLSISSLCAAAKDFFVVDPSGYVRACNHSPRRVGHIFNAPIIDDIEYWNIFAERNFGLPEMCEGCASVSECDCGCRETASICYGSLAAPDPCMEMA